MRPVGVWQELSGDGGQTAWLDVKSLRKKTELVSCPGHALLSVFLPLLVLLIMLFWFVSLSSLELASQLVPHSVITCALIIPVPATMKKQWKRY